jgi:hypothetical protein
MTVPSMAQKDVFDTAWFKSLQDKMFAKTAFADEYVSNAPPEPVKFYQYKSWPSGVSEPIPLATMPSILKAAAPVSAEASSAAVQAKVAEIAATMAKACSKPLFPPDQEPDPLPLAVNATLAKSVPKDYKPKDEPKPKKPKQSPNKDGDCFLDNAMVFDSLPSLTIWDQISLAQQQALSSKHASIVGTFYHSRGFRYDGGVWHGIYPHEETPLIKVEFNEAQPLPPLIVRPREGVYSNSMIVRAYPRHDGYHLEIEGGPLYRIGGRPGICGWELRSSSKLRLILGTAPDELIHAAWQLRDPYPLLFETERYRHFETLRIDQLGSPRRRPRRYLGWLNPAPRPLPWKITSIDYIPDFTWSPISYSWFGLFDGGPFASAAHATPPPTPLAPLAPESKPKPLPQDDTEVMVSKRLIRC